MPAGWRVPPDKPMATIVRVLSTTPIVGADSIESVQVLGWNCVAKKGEFEPGQLCVYFMIGSCFPADYTRTTFLEGKPLKTKKLRGCISQGLLGSLEWLQDFNVDASALAEGDDVTKHFGILSYISREEAEHREADANVTAGKLAPFPAHIPKTNEERIQNIPQVLDRIRDREVVITRKEDGCSATYIFQNGVFIACGRNFIMPEGTIYYAPVDKYSIGQRMTEYGRNLAIQGEIIGPTVNGNHMKLAITSFRVFNVLDLDDKMYLSHEEIEEVCGVLGLETVPVLFKGLARDAPMLSTVPTLLAYADSVTYHPSVPAEGVVVKVNERTPRRWSFKAISNVFLLKIGQ